MVELGNREVVLAPAAGRVRVFSVVGTRMETELLSVPLFKK
jgi:hypothetical protein